MASGLYTSYKEACLSQSPSVDMDTDTIKARLVTDATYTVNLAAHDFIDDVTAYASTTDQTLSNKTVTNGVFDNTADLTWTAVAYDSGNTVAIVVYKDTGTPATSPVVSYNEFDVAITPDGNDIVVSMNASGIYAL